MSSDPPQVSSNEEDIRWMLKAVKLAYESNPVDSAYCVGCIVVGGDGKEIATGYSRELEGNTHAEECALRKMNDALKNGSLKSEDLKDLKMYATMEPCSKRTSGNTPCVSSILQFGRIKRVFVGALEPKQFVDCEGVAQLLKHKIEVVAVRMKDDASGIKRACLRPNHHVLDPRGHQPFRIRLRNASDTKFTDLLDNEHTKNLANLNDGDDSGSYSTTSSCSSPLRSFTLIAEGVRSSESKWKAARDCRGALTGTISVVALTRTNTLITTTKTSTSSSNENSNRCYAVIEQLKIASKEDGGEKEGEAYSLAAELVKHALERCKEVTNVAIKGIIFPARGKSFVGKEYKSVHDVLLNQGFVVSEHGKGSDLRDTISGVEEGIMKAQSIATSSNTSHDEKQGEQEGEGEDSNSRHGSSISQKTYSSIFYIRRDVEPS
mmetsp:Transcript_32319/g.52376  ORF Transcript_32319/g.52376 Transcript_32319/m.52376 type:complete len:435 (+) Transcript_32319:49-1353(+)